MSNIEKNLPATKADVEGIIESLAATKADIEGVVESLAVSLQSEFSNIYKRFDEIDAKFTEKLEGMDSRIIGVNNRLDSHAISYTRRDEYSKLEKRVTKIEKAIA